MNFSRHIFNSFDWVESSFKDAVRTRLSESSIIQRFDYSKFDYPKVCMGTYNFQKDIFKTSLREGGASVTG